MVARGAVVSTFVAWVIGGLVLSIGILFVFQSPLAAAISGLLLFLVGERDWLWEWAMALFNTPKLLIDQQRNLQKHIVPSVAAVVYPGAAQSNQDCLNVTLEWDNRTFMRVELSRQRGAMSVDGAPVVLPANLKDITIGPFKKQQVTMTVQLIGGALAAVQSARKAAAKGYVSVTVNLTVTVTSAISLKKPGPEHDFVTDSFTAFNR